MNPPLPEIIGPYRVVRLLAQGGMGLVLVAVHARFPAPVALKLLRPEVAADPALRARFHREAAVLQRLAHPSIVALLDRGELPDGTLFLAMELLPGASLRSYLIERGALPLQAVIGIGRQVAAALCCAHDQGIIHRDLKPENIVVVAASAAGSAPAIKVIDFGLAKAPPLALGSRTELGTNSSATLGTMLYMAPEQLISASAVTGLADVYALGLLLRELLCGEPRAEGGVYNRAPVWFADLIDEMTAQDPARRPSMAVVHARLRTRPWRLQIRSARGLLRRAQRALVLALSILGALSLSTAVYWAREQRAATDAAAVFTLWRQSDKVAARYPRTVNERRAQWQSAVSQAQRLRVTPEVATVLTELYHGRSELEMSHGHIASARQWQDDAARLLLRALPYSALSIASWEGGLAKQEGRLNQSQSAYGAVLRQLSLAPGIDDRLRLCAVAQEGIGEILWHRGQLGEAERAFLEAERCERARDKPREAYLRFVDSYHRFWLGVVAASAGRWMQAEQRFAEALSPEGSSAWDPALAYQTHRGRVQCRWAQSLFHLGRRELAIKEARRGLTLLQGAAEQDDAPSQLRALAEAEEVLGELLTDTDRGDTARNLNEQALRRRRRLWQADPQDGLAAHDLLIALANASGKARPDAARAEMKVLLQNLAKDRRFEGDTHLSAARGVLASLEP